MIIYYLSTPIVFFRIKIDPYRTRRPYLTAGDQVFHAAAEGFLVIDTDFVILRISRSLLDLLETDHQKTVWRKCHDVLKCGLCHGPD